MGAFAHARERTGSMREEGEEPIASKNSPAAGERSNETSLEDAPPSSMEAADKSGRVPRPWVIAGVVVCTLIAVVWASTRPTGPSELEIAYAACASHELRMVGVQVSDDGDSIAVDTPGVDGLIGAINDSLVSSRCVLDELQAPDSVQELVENTTPQMGPQEESWNGVHASWSFDPDRGLQMMISVQD